MSNYGVYEMIIEYISMSELDIVCRGGTVLSHIKLPRLFHRGGRREKIAEKRGIGGGQKIFL